MMPADSIAAELLDAILVNLKPRKGIRRSAAGERAGAELLWPSCTSLCNAAHHRLSGNGLQVQRTLVGNFTTSLEMGGARRSRFVLLDEEILRPLG